jgi:hypothetical protein
VLVVEELLRELDELGSLQELEARLEALPPDLPTFFQHIIDSTEVAHRTYMARLLLCMLHKNTVGMRIRVISFLWKDQEQWHTTGVQPQTKAEYDEALERRTEESKRRVQKWCKDFVQVDHCHDLQFSHRSVGDYLHLPETLATLSRYAGDAFVPLHELCRLYVEDCRFVAGTAPEPYRLSSLMLALGYAAELEATTGETPRELLSDLNNIVSPYFPRWIYLIAGNVNCANAIEMIESYFVQEPQNLQNLREQARHRFLTMAAMCSVCIFVKQELDSMSGAGFARAGEMILFGLLNRALGAGQNLQRKAKLIRHLLGRGVNVNARIGNGADAATLWELSLRLWRGSPSQFPRGERLYILSLVMDAGADRRCCIPEAEESLCLLLHKIVTLDGSKCHDEDCRTLREILMGHGIATDDIDNSCLNTHKEAREAWVREHWSEKRAGRFLRAYEDGNEMTETYTKPEDTGTGESTISQEMDVPEI